MSLNGFQEDDDDEDGDDFDDETTRQSRKVKRSFVNDVTHLGNFLLLLNVCKLKRCEISN